MADNDSKIEACATAIAAVWDSEVGGSEYALRASAAAANLKSSGGTDLLYAPSEVARMLTQAIEIGYVTALEEVRKGNFDDDTP